MPFGRRTARAGWRICVGVGLNKFAVEVQSEGNTNAVMRHTCSKQVSMSSAGAEQTGPADGPIRLPSPTPQDQTRVSWPPGAMNLLRR